MTTAIACKIMKGQSVSSVSLISFRQCNPGKRPDSKNSVPGNHDWFDGLASYTRYVLSRDWLGGWLIPQRTSYFALKLPKGWWLLGFDLALDDDINIEQVIVIVNCSRSCVG